MKIYRIRYVILILSFLFFMYGGYLGLRFKVFMPAYQCSNNDSYKGGGCYLLPLQRVQYGIKMDSNSDRGMLPFPGYTVLWGPWRTYGQWALCLFLVVLLTNRAWCGWMCPFGAFQDLATFVRKKFFIRETQFSDDTKKKLNYTKYFLFFLFLSIHFLLIFNIPIARNMDPPYCRLCPTKLFLPLLEGNPLNYAVDFTVGIGRFWTSIATPLIGGLALVGIFFRDRCFCNVCPVGMCMDLTKKASIFKLKKNTASCSGCGNCWRVCPMDIKEVCLEKEKKDAARENCIFCLKCIEACPSDKTLSAEFLKKNIFSSSRRYFTKWIRGRIDRDENAQRKS